MCGACDAAWWRLSKAADTIDDLLRRAGLAKQDDDPNPLTRGGFDTWVRGLTADLLADVDPDERAAIDQTLRNLERDYSSMSEQQRDRSILRATAPIAALAAILSPRVGPMVANGSRSMMLATGSATIARYNFAVPRFSLNVVDERRIRAIRTRAAFFVRDEYGLRRLRASAIARQVVATGTRRGEDPRYIARRMEGTLRPWHVNRSQAYYTNVASIYQARARSYGSLRSFQDAGIRQYRFHALLDERTTEICRMMHDRVFDVGPALDRFAAVDRAGPESVYDLQPFVNQGRDDEGNRILYYNRGDERVQVARVLEPGFGRQDTVGRYSGQMSSSALASAGIGAPPLHGRCRSEIIPITS